MNKILISVSFLVPFAVVSWTHASLGHFTLSSALCWDTSFSVWWDISIFESCGIQKSNQLLLSCERLTIIDFCHWLQEERFKLTTEEARDIFQKYSTCATVLVYGSPGTNIILRNILVLREMKHSSAIITETWCRGESSVKAAQYYCPANQCYCVCGFTRPFHML